MSATTAVRVTGGAPSAKSTSPPNPGCRPGPPPADASTTSAIAVRSDTSGVVVIGCGCPSTVTAIGPVAADDQPGPPVQRALGDDDTGWLRPRDSAREQDAEQREHGGPRALRRVGIDDDIVQIATPGVVEWATASHQAE